jgi:hypothetical protein
MKVERSLCNQFYVTQFYCEAFGDCQDYRNDDGDDYLSGSTAAETAVRQI